ncbi:MAG: hypothetical protein ACKODX_02215, partial [Gemmata sp.]
MRTTPLAAATPLALFALLLHPGVDHAQPPGGSNQKPPPDEYRSLVREVEEAYKAPYEVDKDVLNELRKQYKAPSAEREAKIFREIRRLYPLTPEQERDITSALRKAYDSQSPEQEQRLFDVIRRNGRLPTGTVPASVQAEQSARLFRGFDRDGNGRLSSDEMPDALGGQWHKWDRNRDGGIDAAEYAEYYQASLRAVSEKVAAGEISIKVPKGAAAQPDGQKPAPVAPAEPDLGPKPVTGDGAPKDALPFAVRFGKLPPGLPAWFTQYDIDQDGQVGLYEW